MEVKDISAKFDGDQDKYSNAVQEKGFNYSKYVYGVLNYQKKYGKVTYLDGNRVDRTGS